MDLGALACGYDELGVARGLGPPVDGTGGRGSVMLGLVTWKDN